MTVYNLDYVPIEAYDIKQVPLKLDKSVSQGVAGLTYYSMRRTDTAASGGYSHWTNTTGDATGAPASSGSVGSPVIVSIL